VNFGVRRADRADIERGYYIHLGSDETSEPPGRKDDAHEGAPPRRRRRPRRVRWHRWILALAVVGTLTWANAQPGGLSKRYADIKASVTGAVSSVIESRELDQATKTFNGWYDQQGQYPNYTQSQLIERTDDSWGAGMDVAWCTPRDVVLTSFTSAGTISRLLIDGEKIGDVHGRAACPSDLVSPDPWTR
jgi:hypothetical protein